MTVPSLPWMPDEYQERYLRALKSSLVTFVDAPSGTGKTTLAVYQGLNLLMQPTSNINKLIYIRFPDDRYHKQGFLPGNLEEKSKGLFGPFYDAALECDFGEADIAYLQSQDQLKLLTDTTLRGVNFTNAFVIVDEAQNARTIDDLHLVLSRLHDNCRAVVIGHSKQQDNRKTTFYAGKTPFQLFMAHSKTAPWASCVKLVHNYRGKISQWADSIWEAIE